jgi:hypothetical protein
MQQHDREDLFMTPGSRSIQRVVGPNGRSPVSFHDAWPLSQSEVLYQKGGFAPTETDPAYRGLVVPIRYHSSF